MSTLAPSPDAVSRIRAELLPGEQLRWTGRPDPRVLFTTWDAFLIPFSLFWCGFAIFWFSSALRSSGLAFAAFGLLPIAVGLYLVVGRFVFKVHQKRRTTYAVTDRRAMIATGDRGLTQVPIGNRPMSIRRGRSHVSVVIGTPARLQGVAVANTGLDFTSRDSGVVGLWDVADADALLAALRGVQSS